MARPSWDAYFMQLCRDVATRASCTRKHCGAVIVRHNRVVSTGYNGSLPGIKHCEEVGCDVVDNHCVRTVHAEQNAIYIAAKYGNALDGATIYCTTFPCWNCAKAIISAGIKEIVYEDHYNPDQRVLDACVYLNIVIKQYIE